MADCLVCGGDSSRGTPLRCGHCGLFFCEVHREAASHGCRRLGAAAPAAGTTGLDGECPRCGCVEFSEAYWGTISDTPVQERSLDWETKLLWWFKAPDFMPFETIEKVDGHFCLHKVRREKARKCKKCGHESKRPNADAPG